MMERQQFFGYRRENGRVGIRNHVVILPLDDLSNAASEAVANNIKGTLALPHAYGRLQFGEDLELFFRTLIGTGSNPNVAACVVIGIEPGWTGRIVDGIAKTGKPVAGFAIEGNGDTTTIANASRKTREFVQWASEKQREVCSIPDLFVSTKCGESDTTSGLGSCPTVGNLIDKLDPLRATTCFGETSELTGAELVCASRAVTKEVGERFLQVFNAYQEVIERHKTSDLSESQPTKGNIIGGLTTIEEKAFGNLQKIGKKAKCCAIISAVFTSLVLSMYMCTFKKFKRAVRKLENLKMEHLTPSYQVFNQQVMSQPPQAFTPANVSYVMMPQDHQINQTMSLSSVSVVSEEDIRERSSLCEEEHMPMTMSISNVNNMH